MICRVLSGVVGGTDLEPETLGSNLTSDWAEDRALRGRNPSADSVAKTEGNAGNSRRFRFTGFSFGIGTQAKNPIRLARIESQIDPRILRKSLGSP